MFAVNFFLHFNLPGLELEADFQKSSPLRLVFTLIILKDEMRKKYMYM